MEEERVKRWGSVELEVVGTRTWHDARPPHKAETPYHQIWVA
jgi:hypothetical protein